MNENTFFGLKNLRVLLLSYNPFKTFEPTTFRHVGASLERLELISNSESDWFTFDDSDVCLLSYFKCRTQVYIDPDQRCNCFVKYVNYMSSEEAGGVQVSDSQVVWFKPCQFPGNSIFNIYIFPV